MDMQDTRDRDRGQIHNSPIPVMPTRYQPGSLVTLKSGGPTMTVTSAERPSDTNPDDVICMWFTTAGDLRTMWFNPFTLKANT